MTLADLVPEKYRTAGLTRTELERAQEEAGTPFPPDLCELLAETLPTGRQFPDWRARARETIEAFRDQMIDGIAFDVAHNVFWLESWGEKPDDNDGARAVIAEYVRNAPALIPVYGHRAIPNEPLEAGNPVFSIVQTDVIVYGADLSEYLRHEFDPQGWSAAQHARTIRFWSDLL